MKTLKKLCLLITLTLLYNFTYCQNDVGETYKTTFENVVNKINKNVYNLQVYQKDSIIYDFRSGDYKSLDKKYFVNDTCYLFTSESSISSYSKDSLLCSSVFNLPIVNNLWTSRFKYEDNRDYYLIIKLEKRKRSTLMSIQGYDTYSEYIKNLKREINKEN